MWDNNCVAAERSCSLARRRRGALVLVLVLVLVLGGAQYVYTEHLFSTRLTSDLTCVRGIPQ